jgi:hypothetical protein
MLTVACVKWGTLYSVDYVHKLEAMVRRNLTLPYQFKCFTDDRAGLDHSIVEPLYSGLESWWGKVSLFQSGLFSDRVLFLDLDTVIIGNIDEIALYDGPFAILRDFIFPQHYGSGVMSWKPSAETEVIWNAWNLAGRPKPKRGDQEIIEKYIRPFNIAEPWQDLFPGQFVSYKLECFFQPPSPQAKIVCFHGTPKPHECKRKFITEHWTTDYRAAGQVGSDAVNLLPTP